MNNDDGLIELHFHRDKRLFKMLKIADAISSDVIEKLHTVSDHEGCLTIRWQKEPTHDDIWAMDSAWDGCNETQTEHFFEGNQLY